MNLSKLSIRTRIQLWHGLLLAGILVALGFAAWRLRWQDELRRIDSGLSQPIAGVHRAMHAAGIGPPGRPPNALPDVIRPQRFRLTEDEEAMFEAGSYYYVVWQVDGTLGKASVNAPQEIAAPKLTTSDPFATRWRTVGVMREAYRFTPPGACMLVGVSAAPSFDVQARLGWWMLALGLGVLGGALLMDAWILRRAIQPVEEIISAAERISRGNLSARIESSAAGAELDRLQNVLNSTFSSLDQAFTQQTRFSGDVAHELRTPVSVLIAETQGALERERPAEDYRETISACLRSARRMSGLIESLLDLAQIQSAAHSERETCDLATLASETVDSLKMMAHAQDIDLQAAFEKAPCKGSASQLTQIVANLLSNAIQHNQRAGRVRIETAQENGRAVLRVENTGAGIPAKDLPHVFDRFYRTDTSRNRKTGGVGLGLAICKAIADAHGAELSVENTEGERTVFTLRMPAA